jgi:hypothetical protein
MIMRNSSTLLPPFVIAAMILSCSPATVSAPQYMLLSDGRVHASSETPTGFYVAGRKEGDRFIPVGKVQGSGEFGREGLPGWMELSDGRFYGDMVARPPFPPYVRGYRVSGGEFRPSSRNVVYP